MRFLISLRLEIISFYKLINFFQITEIAFCIFKSSINRITLKTLFLAGSFPKMLPFSFLCSPTLAGGYRFSGFSQAAFPRKHRTDYRSKRQPAYFPFFACIRSAGVLKKGSQEKYFFSFLRKTGEAGSTRRWKYWGKKKRKGNKYWKKKSWAKI